MIFDTQSAASKDGIYKLPGGAMDSSGRTPGPLPWPSSTATWFKPTVNSFPDFAHKGVFPSAIRLEETHQQAVD